MGLLFYSDLAAGTFYQLEIEGKSGYTALRGFGTKLSGDTQSRLSIRGDRWYRFKIRVYARDDELRIKARIWPDDGEEPSRWPIEAKDTHQPLKGGAIAVFASKDDTRFDDLRVKAISDEPNAAPCR